MSKIKKNKGVEPNEEMMEIMQKANNKVSFDELTKDEMVAFHNSFKDVSFLADKETNKMNIVLINGKGHFFYYVFKVKGLFVMTLMSFQYDENKWLVDHDIAANINDAMNIMGNRMVEKVKMLDKKINNLEKEMKRSNFKFIIFMIGIAILLGMSIYSVLLK